MLRYITMFDSNDMKTLRYELELIQDTLSIMQSVRYDETYSDILRCKVEQSLRNINNLLD